MCISRSRSFIHMLLICMLFSTQGLSIQHFRDLVLRTKRASENCGISKTTAITLITKGVVAEQHEFPWIVAIYNATNDFICSGTIISPNYVLTAAHCVSNPFGIPLDTTQYMIVAGKYYKDLKITDEFSQSRQIKKLTVHEDYRGVNHRYRDDIALVELDRKLQISDIIQPICMDWYSTYERNDFQNDNKGVIAGWGRNENGDYNEVLHKLDVPYRNRSICVKDLPPKFESLYFTSDKFCAGFIGKNTGICNGDSGGGLIFKSDGRRYFLRGIASLSVADNGICNPNFYALYTQVSRYLNWLRDSSQDSFEINLQSIDSINRNDRNKHGCRLPKHRTNSTFILLENDRDYIEDAVIEPWKGITFSCNGHGRYKTGQYQQFYCINQQWTPSLDEVYCIRQCESLLSTHTYNIYCYRNGQNVSCEDPIEGTRAETQCKPSYEFRGKRSASTCINGVWDSYLSPCTPIPRSTTTGKPNSIVGCIAPNGTFTKRCFPPACGKKRVDAPASILDGSKIVQNDYPWIVGIYDTTLRNDPLTCYGTLISRSYVLSAARCFANRDGKPNNKNDYTLVAGKSKIGFDIQEDGMQVRRIKKLWIHEGYKGKEDFDSNDIALIETEEFDLSLTVLPVCIDWIDEYGKENQTGPILAWNRDLDNVTVVYNLTASIISKDDCRGHFTAYYFRNYYTDDKFCARTNTKDGSNLRVASGSGLYLPSQWSRFYIRGIASVAPTRDSYSGDYGFYTNVSKYLSWIENIIGRRV